MLCGLECGRGPVLEMRPMGSQDPSVCPDPMLLSGMRSRLGSGAIDTSVWQAVAAANPDVLITPEHHKDSDFSYVAPLWQLFQDFKLAGDIPARTPNVIRPSVPGAFSTIIMNNAGLLPGDTHYKDLVTGVSQGDILIARAWFNDQPDLGTLNQSHAAAAKLPPIPRIIPGGRRDGDTRPPEHVHRLLGDPKPGDDHGTLWGERYLWEPCFRSHTGGEALGDPHGCCIGLYCPPERAVARSEWHCRCLGRRLVHGQRAVFCDRCGRGVTTTLFGESWVCCLTHRRATRSMLG